MLGLSTNTGTFNAKWLTPKDVARTFVLVPQFRQLIQNNSSVLLGPRGCGKTTLLKMLTRPALDEWFSGNRTAHLREGFKRPGFEAIYIPADVRWFYELANLENIGLDPILTAKSQRLMVSTNAIANLLSAVAIIVQQRRDVEAIIATHLIKYWNLKGTMKSFSDVQDTLCKFGDTIRGYLAVSDVSGLSRFFEDVEPGLFGHAIDAPSRAIEIVSKHLPDDLRPTSWALCFDELEIAPGWLRTEILEALRSTNPQNIFIKATWTPLLPSGLRTAPESAADFKAIRLWHSHLADPKSFCEDLTREFLRQRFPDSNIEPAQFFSRSILASEEADEPIDAYERYSTEYEIFKSLVKWDESFKKLMTDRRMNIADPVPKNTKEKDQFYRKVKPIALLRHEFLSPNKTARGRKTVTVYAGREAVYAMSEGNPRSLLNLLNDFVSYGIPDASSSELRVKYATQASILNSAAQRHLAYIKACVFFPPRRPSGAPSFTLFDVVQKIGRYFRGVVLAREFPLDPSGSFTVPVDTDNHIIALVEQLLERGSIVYVGTSSQDVPLKIPGSRFRLTYMLAPIYRLPLRLYREISLDEILAVSGDQFHPELPLTT